MDNWAAILSIISSLASLACSILSIVLLLRQPQPQRLNSAPKPNEQEYSPQALRGTSHHTVLVIFKAQDHISEIITGVVIAIVVVFFVYHEAIMKYQGPAYLLLALLFAVVANAYHKGRDVYFPIQGKWGGVYLAICMLGWGVLDIFYLPEKILTISQTSDFINSLTSVTHAILFCGSVLWFVVLLLGTIFLPTRKADNKTSAKVQMLIHLPWAPAALYILVFAYHLIPQPTLS